MKPAPVLLADYTILLSLHGIILLPEEWRLNAIYVKKNMTLLRCPIEKGLDMLGGKWKSRILCVLAQRGPIPVRTVQAGDDQCD